MIIYCELATFFTGSRAHGTMIGVRGNIIYCEFATFFTGSRAHGTMIGVKGNIALASILFCVQHVITPEDWCLILVRF